MKLDHFCCVKFFLMVMNPQRSSSANMEGYSKLASIMDSHSDVRIFQNFSVLNIQNILYLQAELLHLQKEWRDIITDDVTSGDHARVDTQFNLLSLQGGIETEEDTVQWEKFKEIRIKIGEYSKITVK